MMHTAESVRAHLESQLENEALPDAVLEVFRREAGKPFTKRILAKLPGGEDAWRISQVANMTSIATADYIRTQGNEGHSFLVAYAIKNIEIDPAFLEESNARHYSARIARNAKRREAMASLELRDKLARALNEVSVAFLELERTKREVESLTEYGGPFESFRFSWEKVAGLKP